MKGNLPQRKHPRLEKYDYSSSGAYFITICTQNRKCILSRVVGRGLAPAASLPIDRVDDCIEYTKYGEIVKQQLLKLEERYSHLKIDWYVIMPNHIHAIIVLDNKTAGASPRPTLTDIVCAYKSLTTAEAKRNGFVGKLFQDSFYEHIIRGVDDYRETVDYILNNPINWYYDELYKEQP